MATASSRSCTATSPARSSLIAPTYDEYLVHPELVRLAAWSRLERKHTGPLTVDPPPRQEEKLAAIAAAQTSGHIDPAFEPIDVFVTVIALSMTWSPASTTFTASSADPEADHERRRGVLRTLVARAYAPQRPGLSPASSVHRATEEPEALA